MNPRNDILIYSFILIICGFIIGFAVGFGIVPKHDFEAVAREVAWSHQYNDTFKCGEFTDVLIDELKARGYSAKISYGYANLTNSNLTRSVGFHAWTTLEINIESTTGDIISAEDFKRYYNIS